MVQKVSPTFLSTNIKFLPSCLGLRVSKHEGVPKGLRQNAHTQRSVFQNSKFEECWKTPEPAETLRKDNRFQTRESRQPVSQPPVD